MAIDVSGQDMLPEEGFVTIEVKNSHPLLRLAAALPWITLVGLVVEDLKKTTGKGWWWMGRKIKVRIHLGAYLLQRLYNLTDRKVEYQLKDNAAFQLFCGLGIVQDWHAPDHTKIEEFRNRLSSETHRQLASTIAQAAVSLGFADPGEVDLGSTVQEANVSYPSDASSTDLVLQERLRNRRSGIEPLIGHAKHGGQLRRSRMKSDLATQGAAYGSVLGLNMRQMIRHQQGKMNDAV